MDRKNQRAAGAVPAVSALAGDDSQDEAVIWKRTLADLQRLSEVMEAGEAITIALDKVPEGRPNRSTLCQEAAEKAREEQEIIQVALENIKHLMVLRDGDLANDSTAEGKRKKRKIEAEGLNNNNNKKIRRYSAADSNGIIPDGHQVAARTPKDKNKQEEWILAKVLSYTADKNKYMVEDDEADEYGKKMTYSLSARSVIMIPDDQDEILEFPAGHTVLALYPSTTCFYKAVVVQPPSKSKEKDSGNPLYRIKFDDDEGIERTAPPRMVLDMPKLK
ncbi:SAGA HAT/Core module component [Mortierella sp. NVP85]|nr:SAGA HAT/Core module component [Mortierella sp. NVP85]